MSAKLGNIVPVVKELVLAVRESNIVRVEYPRADTGVSANCTFLPRLDRDVCAVLVIIRHVLLTGKTARNTVLTKNAEVEITVENGINVG